MFNIQLQLDLAQKNLINGDRRQINFSDEDNLEELIFLLCEQLSQDEVLNFTTEGFGLDWPVDISTDLAIILPQIDGLLTSLNCSVVQPLEFYEQGIERILEFSLTDSNVVITCNDLFGNRLVDTNEILEISELVTMLHQLRSCFITTCNSMYTGIDKYSYFDVSINS